MSIEINHVLIRSNNFKNMRRFFTEAVGLEEGIRPPFDFLGTWLYANDRPLIHLVDLNTDGQNQSHYRDGKIPASEANMGIVDHIALSGTDYNGLITRLRQQKVKYFESTVLLTNEHQAFVKGPEGLELELLFNRDKSQLT